MENVEFYTRFGGVRGEFFLGKPLGPIEYAKPHEVSDSKEFEKNDEFFTKFAGVRGEFFLGKPLKPVDYKPHEVSGSKDFEKNDEFYTKFGGVRGDYFNEKPPSRNGKDRSKSTHDSLRKEVPVTEIQLSEVFANTERS